MRLIPYEKKYLNIINDIYGHTIVNKFTNNGIYCFYSILGIFKSNLYMYVNNSNEVIGLGCIIRKLNLKSFKRETWISGINICPAYRRQGHATKMMLMMINECRIKNYNNLQLYVKRNNISACRLYERLGFYYDTVNKKANYYKMVKTI